MPVKLYLMRHGETEWSLSGQHTGTTDIPLTANGEEEARRLAPRLTSIRFSVVSGGILSVIGTIALAAFVPALRRYDAKEPQA